MITDDPHSQTTTAADEQPAGGDAPARAELLGTTPLTARVRCPCGKRQDVDREEWQWFGVEICPRCGRGLLDHSLRVVGRREALAMIEERKPTEGELRALWRMEMALRDFVLRYEQHPHWYWSPPTNAMAGEVGRLLSELDESRKDRGAPPVVAGGDFLDEGEGGEYGRDADDGADDDDEGDEPEEAPPRTAWDIIRARGREASAGLAAELAAARQAAGGEEADEDEEGDGGEGEEALDEEEG